MKLISWNINSIRACVRKGFLGFFDRNVDWKIDCFMVSKSLQSRIKSVEIHSEILGSDHCPVELAI